MGDEYILNTDSMKFIGAGKIMYNNFSPDFNIPHLHFLVIQYEKDMYQAVNLELQLFAAGDTFENAIAELATLTTTHILAVLKDGRGYDELIETALEKTMDSYWREYRKIEFNAAKHKRDIGHNVEQRINNIIKDAIKDTISEKLKIFIKECIQKNADDIEEILNLLGYVTEILYQAAA